MRGAGTLQETKDRGIERWLVWCVGASATMEQEERARREEPLYSLRCLAAPHLAPLSQDRRIAPSLHLAPSLSRTMADIPFTHEQLQEAVHEFHPPQYVADPLALSHSLDCSSSTETDAA